MTEYKKPELSELENMIIRYINTKRNISPWTFDGDGFEIEYSDWPLQLDDVLKNGDMRFNKDNLVYELNGWEETDFEKQIRQINMTGGEYIQASQILGVSGKVGLKLDDESDKLLVFDENKTDLEVEIDFLIRGGSSYPGETPPF